MNHSVQSLVQGRRIKKLVTLIKALYPTLRRIPAPLPRPGSEALKTPKMGDPKKDAARKEAYGLNDPLRLDSSTATFFLHRATLDEPRRSRTL